MPFDIFLLVLIYSLHVLNHLVIARRYHVTILVLHHIVCVLRPETLHLFALSSGGALLLLEKCHVKFILSVFVYAPEILSNAILGAQVLLCKVYGFLIR